MVISRSHAIGDYLVVEPPKGSSARMGALVVLAADADSMARCPLWRADVERLIEVLQEALT